MRTGVTALAPRQNLRFYAGYSKLTLNQLSEPSEPSVTIRQMLFLRALTSFLLLPGLIAYAVPILIEWDIIRTGRPSLSGVILLGLGSALLFWCVRDFYAAGKGTLAPWDPPKKLVRVGLYRFTRNPMYVSVTTVLIGWALTYRSWPLAIYAACVAVAFHLRVVLGEEPWLARTHGDAWRDYTSHVPRWFRLG